MLKKLFRSYLINSLINIHDLLITDSILSKNSELKNKYDTKRLFILGSGSSILLYDLKMLKDEYVMTQNSFHMHEDISEINSNFHCVVPYYQTEKELDTWIEYIADMKGKMPNSLFIWGKNTKELIDKHHKDLSNKSYYIKGGYDLLTLDKAKVDITHTIMPIPTVLTQCLTVAIYMGFKEIYLLGFDLDQICYTNDRTYGRFYGMSKITDTQAEQNAEKRIEEETTDGWYNRWLMNKQFFLIKNYAKRHNINIINGTKGGILSYFKRLPIENVLGQSILVDKK